MTSGWLLASGGLIPPLLVAATAAGSGKIVKRLVGSELVTSLAIFTLLALSFAFEQPSSIDLALTLALLTLPGTVILALFVERWL